MCAVYEFVNTMVYSAHTAEARQKNHAIATLCGDIKQYKTYMLLFVRALVRIHTSKESGQIKWKIIETSQHRPQQEKRNRKFDSIYMYPRSKLGKPRGIFVTTRCMFGLLLTHSLATNTQLRYRRAPQRN